MRYRTTAEREALVAKATTHLADGLTLPEAAQRLSVSRKWLAKLLRRAGIGVEKPSSRLPFGLPVD